MSTDWYNRSLPLAGMMDYVFRRFYPSLTGIYGELLVVGSGTKMRMWDDNRTYGNGYVQL